MSADGFKIFLLSLCISMNVHRNKSTNESKGKPEHKFDAAYGTIFQRSKQKLHICFPLELDRLKMLKHLAHEQKVLI
jgi:hypothetical protein